MDDITEYYNKLDRSFFLDEEQKRYAEVDSPLPIGYGQTISQPSLVLQMTKLLEPGKDLNVLEIGTGSGYQTALLAEFSKYVYTVELIKELSIKAKNRLDKMGFENIDFKIGDASKGLIEKSPFDRIMVTAAAGKYPDDLVDQLANNGRMVIPLGQRYNQKLLLITKDNIGRVNQTIVGYVVFVEFKGKYGF